MQKSKRATLEPSPFFVLRTPLLPFEELERLDHDMALCAALDSDSDAEAAALADQARLRERLAELIARPEIYEALFVASPSLMRGAELWRRQPESKKGRRFERSLLRYVLRMSTRSTPFGLFAGCSAGELGEQSRLELPGRQDYRRHTRLDMDYLFALCEDLCRLPAVRAVLSYRPNSSLYRTGGRLRYAEARLAGKDRSYHLVTVEESEALASVLRNAAGGATPTRIAATLLAELSAEEAENKNHAGEAQDEETVSAEDVAAFVDELIETQILVPELTPPVTGREPIHDLIERLEALDGTTAVATALGQARGALEALDAGGLGADPDSYRDIARGLEVLPTPVDLPRLFQVDMRKPAPGLCLGRPVIDEISGAIELLHQFSDRARLPDELETFRQRFVERYGEGREVSLAEALDEELGIGIEDSGSAGDVAPLLDGLGLVPPPRPPQAPWTRRESFLLAKLQEATAAGAKEIVLGRRDIEELTTDPAHRPRLPDAVEVMATVCADSAEALDAGEFTLAMKGATGPSGVRLLGRFCHSDGAIESGVRGHLAAEESLEPEALFAEIVHLPAGRTGNVLCRPVLRPWEIAYLGRSGAPRERQIPISDLVVTVAGGRVVLRSLAQKRRVIPRLTSAHNYTRGSLGLYRFLGALQTQGVAAGLTWSWGSLENASFRPRVRHGRLVLARASWRVVGRELEKLRKGTAAKRFRAVRSWRERRGLPSRLVHLEGDQELFLDFDQLFSVEAWLDTVKGRSVVDLAELYPAPDQLPVSGPEGRFVHELVISFVRRGEPRVDEPRVDQSRVEQSRVDQPRVESAPSSPSVVSLAATPRPAAESGLQQRRFPPGSPWLYACLYTGSATADQVLSEVVAPVIREALRSGACDRWFFIRYGDPSWHLRLRLFGSPARLLSEVLPALECASRPLLEDGRLWRFALDTYDRELERYGGDAGMALCEEIFWHDSEAALAIVRMLEGEHEADMRWRLALRGLDDLFEDLGFDHDGKYELARRLAAGYRAEFVDSKGLRLNLSRRWREERGALEGLLDRSADRKHDLWPALAALHHRSKRLAPVVAELRRRVASGFSGRVDAASQAWVDLAGSLAHMFVNRLLRSNQRAHEAVLFDLLTRLYAAQRARAQAKTPDR